MTTRDTELEDLRSENLRLTEAIRHLQEKWKEKAADHDGKRMEWMNRYQGWPISAAHYARMAVYNECTSDLAGLLSLPRSQENK